MKAEPITICYECSKFLDGECDYFRRRNNGDPYPGPSCPLPDVPELPSATTLTLENRYEMMAAFISALRGGK